MNRLVGVTSRGIRAPIIKQGDDLAQIVTDCVLQASKREGFELHDRDVVAVTESVVARSQGNYAKTDAIGKDVRAKLGGGTVGVLFPILSRNRFSHILEGIAKGCDKVVIALSYPSDEVGNHLFSEEMLDESGVDPFNDVLSLAKYREIFGYPKHPFTGMDYVEYYDKVVKEAGSQAEIIFTNQAKAILDYTDTVICADIHTRFRNKRRLEKLGARKVITLSDLLTAPVEGSGYNAQYGLLGSNISRKGEVKLFPREDKALVYAIQSNIFNKTGKRVEVMVYGDGAFKDPQGEIWELADPVVSPFFTDGLLGTPNEIKLKYLADNAYDSLRGEAALDAIKREIAHKDADLVGKMASQGTTPRQITDLLGSLCDLTSGSGDKGTPIVLVQGYFDNLAND